MERDKIIFYRSEIETVKNNAAPSSFDSARINIINAVNKSGIRAFLVYHFPVSSWSSRPHWSDKLVFLPCINIKGLSFVTRNLTLIFYWLKSVLSGKTKAIVTDLNGVFALVPIAVLKKIFFKKVNICLDIRSMSIETLTSIDEKKTIAALKLAHRHFDKFSFITEDMMKMIEKDFSIKFENYFFWSSGVDDNLFKPEYSAKTDAEFKIIYHGSVSPSRGLDDLVNSIAVLKEKNIKVKLIVLGSADAYVHYKDYMTGIFNSVEALNLKDRIEFKPPVPHNKISDEIRSCQLGVVPIQDKPWWIGQSPLKLLEYLSCGLPVVITNINCNRNVVGNNICGVYCEAGNSRDMAEKIEKIYNEYYNDRQMYEKRAKNGREVIEKDYTWKKQAEKIINNVYY